VTWSAASAVTGGYLKFLAGRCRPNTVLAVAYDLKVFFTVVGKLPVPSMGWFAHFLDPEGNTIGLLQPDANAAPARHDQRVYPLAVTRPAARLTGCPCAKSGGG
jgi:hypothetical protein